MIKMAAIVIFSEYHSLGVSWSISFLRTVMARWAYSNLLAALSIRSCSLGIFSNFWLRIANL